MSTLLINVQKRWRWKLDKLPTCIELPWVIIMRRTVWWGFVFDVSKTCRDDFSVYQGKTIGVIPLNPPQLRRAQTAWLSPFVVQFLWNKKVAYSHQYSYANDWRQQSSNQSILSHSYTSTSYIFKPQNLGQLIYFGFLVPACSQDPVFGSETYLQLRKNREYGSKYGNIHTKQNSNETNLIGKSHSV